MAMDDIVDGLSEVSCDVLVIGGGTAGPMAALKAKLKNPEGQRHSAGEGERQALRRDLDGHGRAEQRRHPRLRDARAVHQGNHHRQRRHRRSEGRSTNTPQRCYSIIEELDSFGIRFLKNENGDFAVKKVHHIGTYVLPMPNGETVKKALYRQLRRARLLISNRYMATRLLTGERRPRRRRHRGQHAHRRIPGASRPRP